MASNRRFMNLFFRLEYFLARESYADTTDYQVELPSWVCLKCWISLLNEIFLPTYPRNVFRLKSVRGQRQVAVAVTDTKVEASYLAVYFARSASSQAAAQATNALACPSTQSWGLKHVALSSSSSSLVLQFKFL